MDCKPHGGNHAKCFTKSNWIRAYKGFDKDLKCRGYQFEVGGEYEEQTAKICEIGFHACEYPLDIFEYYPPNRSRYAEVEIDASEERHIDTKRVGKKIKISAEMELRDLIDAGVKFIFEKIDWNNAKESNTGYRSAATNTGHQSAATNTGHQSAAMNTGYRSAATNTGDGSAATNTGDQSAATNTGHQSAANVTGNAAVAIATGRGSTARGALGCAIVVTERGEWDGSAYPLLAICSAIVDGKSIKADTWYTVKNGVFLEVTE